MATVANDLRDAEERKESVSSLESVLLDLKREQRQHIKNSEENIKALDFMLDLLAKNPQAKTLTDIALRLKSMGLNL